MGSNISIINCERYSQIKKTPGSVFAIKQTDCMRNTFWIAVLEAWDKLFSKRILTTNKFLNICKINDNLCYVCNLFWLCPVTNNFWKEVTVVLKPYIDLSGLFCTTTVLLGIRSKENSRIFEVLYTQCPPPLVQFYMCVCMKKCSFSMESN